MRRKQFNPRRFRDETETHYKSVFISFRDARDEDQNANETKTLCVKLLLGGTVRHQRDQGDRIEIDENLQKCKLNTSNFFKSCEQI